jgi:hypothetical protein
MFKVGSTSKLIKGHVLDVNPKSLEEKLKEYDKQLYLKWNPKKRGGLGVWEIRRHNDKMTQVYYGEYEGSKLFRAEYTENNFINHVLDVEILGYHVIDKLASIDTFRTHKWVDALEYNETKMLEKEDSAARETVNYWAKQNKTLLRDFKELLLSGRSPAELANYWNK